MLDKCAPGYTKDLKTHHWWIGYGGKTYETLPTGTKRSRGYVFAGHVRSMARWLGILDCAKEFLGI